jgi:hypothetical protein
MEKQKKNIKQSSSHERKWAGYLTPSLNARASAYIESRNISRSQLINEAVRVFVNKNFAGESR